MLDAIGGTAAVAAGAVFTSVFNDTLTNVFTEAGAPATNTDVKSKAACKPTYVSRPIVLV